MYRQYHTTLIRTIGKLFVAKTIHTIHQVLAITKLFLPFLTSLKLKYHGIVYTIFVSVNVGLQRQKNHQPEYTHEKINKSKLAA